MDKILNEVKANASRLMGYQSPMIKRYNFVKRLLRVGWLNFNWRLIRSIGGLSILTRVSYLSLALIPFLVCIWSPIKHSQNKINSLLLSWLSLSDNLSAKISNLILDQNLNQLLNEFNVAMVNQKEIIQKMIELMAFPFSWSLAAIFFASLFIILGHFIYQVFSDSEVQKYSLDEYLRVKKKNFLDEPSLNIYLNSQRFALSNIISYKKDDIEWACKLMEELYTLSEDEKITKKIEDLHWSKKLLFAGMISEKSFAYPTDFGRSILEKIRKVIVKNERISLIENLTIIERGAKSEYLYNANKNKIFFIVSFMLYCTGLVIIFLIIKKQSLLVLDASGYSSIIDFIFH